MLQFFLEGRGYIMIKKEKVMIFFCNFDLI